MKIEYTEKENVHRISTMDGRCSSQTIGSKKTVEMRVEMMNYKKKMNTVQIFA
jgi:hypothetical protein